MLSLRKLVERGRQVSPILFARQPAHARTPSWPLSSRVLYSTLLPTPSHPLPPPQKAIAEEFHDGSSLQYMEQMYKSWVADPSSVHKSWDTFFNSEAGIKKVANVPNTTTHQMAQSPSDVQKLTDSMKLVLLIRSYQVRGHVLANLDPLGLEKRAEPPELKPSKYGFTDEDLDREIYTGGNEVISPFVSSGQKFTTLREVLKRLRSAYCGTIGVEYTHIQERDQWDWIRDHFEVPSKYNFTKEEKVQILDRLAWGSLFESTLGAKFGIKKRFGLDGGESLMPGLKALIDTAADLGVNSVVIGMPHRGRLNVLANVVRKPLKNIFYEFKTGEVVNEQGGEYSSSGDVKYHLGASFDRTTQSGKKVHLSLVPNPSHLEAVDPVVEGKARAKQHYANDTERSQIMSIVMHGDAAFAGQGVVYETLHMSYLKNYTTGGTIHIIVNNQIGFTANPTSARSSPYCTDVAKTIGAPIFHVNGDDTEAVVHVMKLAANWRQTFKKDVIIDIICYRRYGHNEGDQPAFTQPIMYQRIEKMVPILKKYSDQLISEQTLTSEEYSAMIKRIQGICDQEWEAGSKGISPVAEPLKSNWEGFKNPTQLPKIGKTGIQQNTLSSLGKVLATVPQGFTPHPSIAKILKQKASMFEGKTPIDYATAEALAFGSLLLEGNHVRLSGQDVERGTFSHRHSVLHDSVNGNTYTPLSHVSSDQPAFTVTNSSLSEFAVLGFELGYSLENPKSLILWEAQFGDFANGAQVIIDQFISSGEMKWMRQSGLVLLLPHGYDGAGPEHSSARLERFLQLCDSDPSKVPPPGESERKQLQHANWCVVNCTTPANYFHALRRQVHRDFRKPLVCMTSKYLLKYSPAHSQLNEFAESASFLRVIPETKPEEIHPPAKVTRLIFCSGQIYYTLIKERQNAGVKDVAIVRIEQLYPFPFDLVTQQAQLYPNADVVWCQEEPMNMGAWNFMFPHLLTALSHKRTPKYAGRAVGASPAVASVKVHEAQLDKLLTDALRVKFPLASSSQ
eukprot:Phypoly_transcript_01735.p1 GENE.Phypoly_transcript_01735~~Phypoly_transcript_01735.p1  ORF type:complete len:1016 (+),score=241.14 Phypoly_transcript_01735:71-3118(+)